MGDIGFTRFGDCGRVSMAGSGAWRIERETYLRSRRLYVARARGRNSVFIWRGAARVQLRVSVRAPGSRGNLCYVSFMKAGRVRKIWALRARKIWALAWNRFRNKGCGMDLGFDNEAAECGSGPVPSVDSHIGYKQWRAGITVTIFHWIFLGQTFRVWPLISNG
jgi:hypothetical protein